MNDQDIKYLREEVKSLSNAFREFMGKQDARFDSLSNTYVRKDLLDLEMKSINSMLCEIKNCQDKLLPYAGMLKEIDKERSSIKYQAISYIGKVIFWIIGILVAIGIAIKN